MKRPRKIIQGLYDYVPYAAYKHRVCQDIVSETALSPSRVYNWCKVRLLRSTDIVY